MLSDDFRLYLNESSEEEIESGLSDDDAGTASPPGQFTVIINYFCQINAVLCIISIIICH